MPRCSDCLSENVTIKLVDEDGFEHWFCAEDWEAGQRLHGKITAMLEDACSALDG